MSQYEPNYYADHEEPPPPESYRAMAAPPASGISIASLVCGAIFCFPVTSLLAVIFGFIGIRKTRNPYVGGKGLSIAGLVLGVFGLAIQMVVGSIIYLAVHYITTEMAQAQAVARQFVQDVSEGKVADAAERTTPGFDRKILTNARDAMKDSGPFNELRCDFQPVPGNNGMFRWEVHGDAVFSRDRKPVTMSLEKDGTTYRVTRFEMK